MSLFGIISRLAGKTALITGASSGIGASTAILFARCGANVILVARRADRLGETKEKCIAAHKESGASGAGGDVVTIQADMSTKADIETLASQVKNRKIDILVNNAGMVRGREHVGDIGEYYQESYGIALADRLAIVDEDIEAMINVNVTGLIRLTQFIVRQMKAQGSGSIINLGSIAGKEAYVGGSIYCATKFAVNAFSTSLMKELVNTPIRVTEIQPGKSLRIHNSVILADPFPGMVETEFSVVRYRGDQSRADNEYNGLTPLTGDDIAEQIVWVASRPDHVQVAEMLIFPTAQAAATISYRKTA